MRKTTRATQLLTTLKRHQLREKICLGIPTSAFWPMLKTTSQYTNALALSLSQHGLKRHNMPEKPFHGYVGFRTKVHGFIGFVPLTPKTPETNKVFLLTFICSRRFHGTFGLNRRH